LKLIHSLVISGFLFFIPLCSRFANKAGSDLYVSTSGDDANPGTIERPFRTIQRAADTAKPGSTVYVRGGTYCQRLTVKVSGDAQQGFITFRSQPGEQAVLDGWCLKPPVGDTSMIELRDMLYVRIEGFEICNYRTNDSRSVPGGIRVFGGGSHIEILKNNVHHIEQNSAVQLRPGQGANGFGIAIYGTDPKTPVSDLVIEGNEIHHLKTGSS